MTSAGSSLSAAGPYIREKALGTIRRRMRFRRIRELVRCRHFCSVQVRSIRVRWTNLFPVVCERQAHEGRSDAEKICPCHPCRVLGQGAARCMRRCSFFVIAGKRHGPPGARTRGRASPFHISTYLCTYIKINSPPSEEISYTRTPIHQPPTQDCPTRSNVAQSTRRGSAPTSFPAIIGTSESARALLLRIQSRPRKYARSQLGVLLA